MRPVVILRPEPGNGLTASRAEEMGIERVVSIPLFKVRPTDWTPPDPERFDGILMSSANAARHGGPGLKTFRDLPVHCVGDATATAARAAGLMIGEVGDAGIDALLERLPDDARLLHLSGRHRHAPTGARQTIVPVAVYSSVPRDPPAAFSSLEGAVACVHSRRSGARLAQLVDAEGLDRSGIRVAAISDDAARDVGDGFARVEIADAPRDRPLLSLAKRLALEED